MKVAEVFKSIQGEGLYTGAPTIFVRMFGCNLACEWCDTKYALEGDYQELCYRDIVRKVAAHSPPPATVCFTGGEPMIQSGRLFARGLKLLKQRGYKIHIETNGTIRPNKRLIPHVDFWSVSPKLHLDFDKIYPPSKFSYRETVKAFCTLESAKQLKFVIAKEEEVPLILNLMNSLELDADIVTNLPIIIQPERFTFEQRWTIGDKFHYNNKLEYLNNFPQLIQWCEKLKGLNYQILPQLHFLLWSGEKGK